MGENYFKNLQSMKSPKKANKHLIGISWQNWYKGKQYNLLYIVGKNGKV